MHRRCDLFFLLLYGNGDFTVSRSSRARLGVLFFLFLNVHGLDWLLVHQKLGQELFFGGEEVIWGEEVLVLDEMVASFLYIAGIRIFQQ